MTICDCYRAERNYAGDIGICYGTKECEACGCGGDQSKCDFYQYLRDRAKQPEPPRTYTAEEVLDCITLVLDSTYECKLCHRMIYPKIYLDGDDIHCEIEANDIRGGRSNHIIVDHICNDCFQRLVTKHNLGG